MNNLLNSLKIEITGFKHGDYEWIAEGGDIELTGTWSRWNGCSAVDVWDNGELSRRLTEAEAKSLNEQVGDAIEEDKDAFFDSVARDCRHSKTPLEDVI